MFAQDRRLRGAKEVSTHSGLNPGFIRLLTGYHQAYAHSFDCIIANPTGRLRSAVIVDR